MPETINDSTLVTLMESKQTRHMEISDHELAKLCLDSTLSPHEQLECWDEFFRRFIRLIYEKIRSTLRVYGDKNGVLWKDEDVIWDINAELVYKFVKKGIIQTCTNLTGLEPWLYTVTENQTIQWLRDNGRLRNLPKKNAEEVMIPIDEPVYDEDGNVTQGHIIKNRRDIYRLERINLEKILGRLDELKNSPKQTKLRDYWVMRLSIIAQLPLTKDDISDFLKFSPLPEQEASQKLDEIIATTERLEKKREGKLGLSIVRESQLRRLESSYNDFIKHDEIKAQEIAKTIEKITGWRVNLLKAGMVIPRPSNAEIAAVLGIDPKQKDYVTTIIQRTRVRLTLSDEEKKKTENLEECQILDAMSL